MVRMTQRGFTLIELMLAVAILSILAAIAIPIYRGFVGEARYGTAIEDIRQMQLILDDLAIDRNLARLDGDNTAELGVYQQAGGALALAAAAPAGATAWNDPWGRIYRCQRPDAATQVYVLFSQGPDAGDPADDVTKD